MTVIDVSEKKQRQLVAEWKEQQEDSKRREKEWEREAICVPHIFPGLIIAAILWPTMLKNISTAMQV